MITARSKGRLAGFILLPVILLLAVIAAVALMMTQKGLVDSKQARNSIDSEQIRYTAEAILAKSEWELHQNDTCAGYSLPASGQFSGYDYTVGLSTTSGSSTTINLSVDLGGGATKQFSREITMYDGSPTDYLTNASQDTHTRSTNNTTNYNSGSEADKLHVLFGSGFFAERISYVQFDLQGFIDLGISPADIQSATLELHSGGSPQVNTVNIKVHRLIEDWNEDQATYLERHTGVSWGFPSIDLTPSALTAVDENVVGWKVWDITTLAKDWLEGTHNNYGIALLGQIFTTNNIEFLSQNNPDTTKRPTLRIAYSPNETECP